jgi:uncharacterized protein YcfJ
MISKAITGFIAAGLLVCGPALAHDGRDEGYDEADAYDFAEVVDVDPIYRDVHVSVPRRECHTEVYQEPQRDFSRADRAAAGPMILGGLIGAVVGHQFGQGSGRNVGTAAGAVVGAAIGHDAAQRRADDDDRGDFRAPRDYEREVCRTRYEERLDREIDGYRVTYRYNGHNYRTQMPYEPGERIRVRVSVDPAGT